MPASRRPLLADAAILCIEVYRNSLSHILLHSCRFLPTCSEYASQALKKHGLGRGGWQAICRLLRCHPFGQAGLDPVK